MEEEQVNPAPESPEPANQELSSMNKLLLPLFIILLLVIGAGAFFIGSQKARQTPAPSPTPLMSPEASVEPSPTGSPTATPKATKTPIPTPIPTPVSQTMTITSTATLDGWRASNGGFNTTWYLQIGRNATLTERSFVSFDISSIPSGKTIDEVTLRLYQEEVVGTPYASLGSLIVDHLDYGDSLGSEDLNASAISSNIGTLTSNASIEWKDLIVTNALKADISSGRSRSQYRLRFATEATGVDAWARFESADNYTPATGNLPQLVVKYH